MGAGYMGWEIERRFLVRVPDGRWPPRAEAHHLRQGYVRHGDPSVRIRTGEPRGPVLTCKGGKGVRRSEVEMVVTDEIAAALFAAAGEHVLEKLRFPLGRWTVDRFLGDLDGLELMEIELEAEDEELPRSPKHVLVLREVTDDRRFVSGRLAALDPKERRKLVKKVYEEVEE
jgi:CYTH domain-containing protein